MRCRSCMLVMRSYGMDIARVQQVSQVQRSTPASPSVATPTSTRCAHVGLRCTKAAKAARAARCARNAGRSARCQGGAGVRE